MVKKTVGEKLFDLLNYIGMLMLCIVMIYPYLNQIAISLNEGMDTSFGGITIFPRKFTLENYYAIFSNESIMQSTVITVICVILATAVSLFVCVSSAYALNEKNLPHKNFFIWFLIIPMYISAGIIPTFFLFRYLKLLNNILVYIIPAAFSFYNMLIIRTFLNSIPSSLEEAALLDGANEVQILFKVIIPLCMPVLATVALWVSVGTWNNWTSTLMFVNKKGLYMLQYVIMQIIKQSEIVQKMVADSAMTGGSVITARPTSETIKAAAVIFSTVPIVMVYPFLQKYFVKGVTIGAVKE